MDPRRLQRLSEAMREELDEIIGYEMEDPRLASVSITEVHISPDSRHARVMVRIPGDPSAQLEALEALTHAGKLIRHQLAERIEVFRVPDLRFELDALVDGNRVDMLLKRIRKGRAKD
jgi:ribosome-binding factor A